MNKILGQFMSVAIFVLSFCKASATSLPSSDEYLAIDVAGLSEPYVALSPDQFVISVQGPKILVFTRNGPNSFAITQELVIKGVAVGDFIKISEREFFAIHYTNRDARMDVWRRESQGPFHLSQSFEWQNVDFYPHWISQTASNELFFFYNDRTKQQTVREIWRQNSNGLYSLHKRYGTEPILQGGEYYFLGNNTFSREGVNGSKIIELLRRDPQTDEMTKIYRVSTKSNFLELRKISEELLVINEMGALDFAKGLEFLYIAKDGTVRSILKDPEPPAETFRLRTDFTVLNSHTFLYTDDRTYFGSPVHELSVKIVDLNKPNAPRIQVIKFPQGPGKTLHFLAVAEDEFVMFEGTQMTPYKRNSKGIYEPGARSQHPGKQGLSRYYIDLLDPSRFIMYTGGEWGTELHLLVKDVDGRFKLRKTHRSDYIRAFEPMILGDTGVLVYPGYTGILEFLNFKK